MTKRPEILLITRCIITNDDGKILIIKRSKNDRYASEEWEFPGGKLEQSEDVNRAVNQEVKEETNLEINPIKRIACIESKIVAEGPYKDMPYVGIIAISSHKSGKVKLSNEHSDYKWVNPTNLPDNLSYSEHVQKSLNALELLN